MEIFIIGEVNAVRKFPNRECNEIVVRNLKKRNNENYIYNSTQFDSAINVVL